MYVEHVAILKIIQGIIYIFLYLQIANASKAQIPSTTWHNDHERVTFIVSYFRNTWWEELKMTPSLPHDMKYHFKIGTSLRKVRTLALTLMNWSHKIPKEEVKQHDRIVRDHVMLEMQVKPWPHSYFKVQLLLIFVLKTKTLYRSRKILSMLFLMMTKSSYGNWRTCILDATIAVVGKDTITPTLVNMNKKKGQDMILGISASCPSSFAMLLPISSFKLASDGAPTCKILIVWLRKFKAWNFCTKSWGNGLKLPVYKKAQRSWWALARQKPWEKNLWGWRQ